MDDWHFIFMAWQFKFQIAHFLMFQLFVWNDWWTKVKTSSFQNIVSVYIVKVRQSQKKIMVSSILPKGTKITFLSREDAQDSEFCLFFGRIEENINSFRDLLTFKGWLALCSIIKKNPAYSGTNKLHLGTYIKTQFYFISLLTWFLVFFP